jgi:ketosteroid isomerase-like protein
MKKYVVVLWSALGCLVAAPLLAQNNGAPSAAQEDPVHGELRALRDGLVDAINKGDIERQLAYLHPNVVVTWQNAEVSRGREGVRAYLDRLLKGPDPVVQGYRTALTVDELTILYGGDTGISFGSSEDHFKLKGGADFSLQGRWSATLVKENGQWLIASLHASANLFDNPLLSLAAKKSYWAGGIALIVGLVVGVMMGRLRRTVA